MTPPSGKPGGSDRPRVLIVFPRQMRNLDGEDGHARYDGSALPMRPLPIYVLGALARREGWDVEVIDESMVPLPKEMPDLVMISVWTCLAPSAYQLATWYRERGVPVVLGGVHPSLLPSEALRYADTVVAGEAEAIFPELMADAAAGRLKPIYHGEWASMDEVPSTSEYHDLYVAGRSWRQPIHGIQTSRGCRFNCSYCSVIRINGRGMRHMQPERVVEEFTLLTRLKPRIPGGMPVYIHDDDLMSDRDYAAQLFETLISAGLRMPLMIQASLGIARDDEVMDLASRAGVVSIFIGLESMARESLVEANKKNRPHEYKELISRIHRHKMGVTSSLIFGFDHDEPDVFDRTVDFLHDIQVDSAHFRPLTPLPGTHTFAEHHAAGRITDLNWARYDAMHTVIRPERMTAQQLSDGVTRVYRRFYEPRARMRRVARQLRTTGPRIAGAYLVGGQRYAAHLDTILARPALDFTPDPADIEQLVRTSTANAEQAITVALRSAKLPEGRGPTQLAALPPGRVVVA